jgi:hypothetical protein
MDWRFIMKTVKIYESNATWREFECKEEIYHDQFGTVEFEHVDGLSSITNLPFTVTDSEEDSQYFKKREDRCGPQTGYRTLYCQDGSIIDIGLVPCGLVFINRHSTRVKYLAKDGKIYEWSGKFFINKATVKD